MATISKFWFLRHLRSDPTFHILYFKGSKQVSSGRGLSFWFSPLSASIAKIPCDDREQAFVITGRSRDFQELTCQGVVSYRVTEPEKLARRFDFSIDLEQGDFVKTPLDQLSQLFTQVAGQYAAQHIARLEVRQLLDEGTGPVRESILDQLPKDPGLWDLGIEIVSIRVSKLAPSAALEKALQAATRESIQQDADKATFERRALAVERERAIEENELKNQIELARREEELIVQRGQNELRRQREESEAKKVAAEAKSARELLAASAQAQAARTLELARLESERERVAIYKELPSQVVLGMAAQELAGNLPKIDHLNLTPDTLGALVQAFANLDGLKNKA